MLSLTPWIQILKLTISKPISRSFQEFLIHIINGYHSLFTHMFQGTQNSSCSVSFSYSKSHHKVVICPRISLKWPCSQITPCSSHSLPRNSHPLSWSQQSLRKDDYISWQNCIIGALLTPLKSVFLLIKKESPELGFHVLGEAFLIHYNSVDSSEAQTGWFVPEFLCLSLKLETRISSFSPVSLLPELLSTSSLGGGSVLFHSFPGRVGLDS